MKLIDALRPDIRKDLERSGIAELVSVSVSAVARPARSRDCGVRRRKAPNFLIRISICF